MVPQHSQDGTMSRAEFELLTSTTTAHNIVTGGQQQQQSSSSIVFGSQLVDKNSITPYSDATQVRGCFSVYLLCFGGDLSDSVRRTNIRKTSLFTFKPPDFHHHDKKLKKENSFEILNIIFN